MELILLFGFVVVILLAMFYMTGAIVNAIKSRGID